MKKRLLKIAGILSLVSLSFSCNDLFNGGDLKSQIDEQVAILNAATVTVRVQTYDPSQGTITPSGDNVYRLGETVNIDFTYNPSAYVFAGWGLINKTNYNYFNNNNGEYVQFSDSITTSVGTLKKVSVKATINSTAENIQIIPIVSDITDNIPPVLTSNEIYLASSMEKFEAGDYLTESAFESWADADFYKNHIKDTVAFNFNAADTGSGVVSLKVRETLIRDVNGQAFNLQKDVSTSETTYQMGLGVFQLKGEYQLRSFADGVYKLDFSLVDPVGNESDLLKTYYVIKDTDVNVPELSLKPTYTATEIKEMIADASLYSPGFYATLDSGSNKVYFTLNKDLWYKNGSKEYRDSQNVSTSIEVSNDNINFYSIRLKNNQAVTQYYMDLRDAPEISRNYNVYVRYTIIDLNGNRKTDVLTLKHSGNVVFMRNQNGYVVPVLSGYSNAAKELVLWTKKSELSPPQLQYWMEDVEYIKNEFGITNVSTLTEKYKSIKFDSNATYYFYCISLDNDKAVLSNRFEMSGSEALTNVKSELTPVYDNVSLVSNGINTGTYTLRATITNFQEKQFEKIIVTDNDNKGVYCVSNDGNIVITTVPGLYASETDENKKPQFICIAFKDGKFGLNIIKPDNSTCTPNTQPVIALKTDWITDAGRTLKVTFPSSTIQRLYYTNIMKDFTDEQIKELPYKDFSNLSGIIYKLSLDTFEEDNYQFFIYSENQYGSYKIVKKQAYLQRDRNFAKKTKTDNSSSKKYLDLSGSNYKSSVIEWYDASNADSEQVKWKATDPGSYKNKFCKVYGYTQGDDSFQYSARYYYFANPADTYVKNVSENGNYLTISSDQPVFVQTLYGPLNRKDAEEWEAFTYDSNIKNIKQFGTVGSTTHEVKFNMYVVPVGDIPAGNWYTTIVHFADGTNKMLTPKYKQ